MSTRIHYDPATAHGKLLAEVCDELATVTAKMTRLKRAVDAMLAGTPTTPQQIEAELGVTAGKGQDVWQLIVDAEAKLTAGNVRVFTDTLDQG